jgi:hypothetical protein
MAFRAGDRNRSRIIRIPMHKGLSRTIRMSGRAEDLFKGDDKRGLNRLGYRWFRRSATSREHDGPHNRQSEKNECSLQRH